MEQMRAAREAASAAEVARANQAREAATIRGQDITDARTREEGASNRAVQMRGQNLTDARSREAGQFRSVDGVGLFRIDPRSNTAEAIVGPDGKPLVASKPPPQYAVEAATLASGGVRKIDEALSALGTPEGKSALGLKNMAPGAVGRAIVNWTDPGGIEARAAVADIGSLEIKNRSGATVTVGEEPRLMPFVPLTTDRPDVAAKKLVRLRQAMVADYDVLGQFHPGVADKVKLPPVTQNKPAAQSAPAGPYSDAEKERRYQEWKKRQGGG